MILDWWALFNISLYYMYPNTVKGHYVTNINIMTVKFLKESNRSGKMLWYTYYNKDINICITIHNHNAFCKHIFIVIM